MKKLIIALCVAGISSIGAAQAEDVTPPATVTVNGGTINFTGEVVNAACAVDVNNLNVDMGQVRLKEFEGKSGTVSKSRTPFEIKLNDCETSVYSTAQVIFQGNSALSGDDTLQAGVGSSAATGIGIQIFDKSGSTVVLGSASKENALQEGTNILHFQSGFISTADKQTAGNVNATASFSLTYS